MSSGDVDAAWRGEVGVVDDGGAICRGGVGMTMRLGSVGMTERLREARITEAKVEVWHVHMGMMAWLWKVRSGGWQSSEGKDNGM